MGIWGNLIKLGGALAAPFTGGASAAVLAGSGAAGSLVDQMGKGAGAASSAAASNRGTKAELMLDAQDQLEKQLLARQLEKRRAQTDAYRKAVQSDRVGRWEPSQRPAGVPTISFTRGPGEQGRQAAQLLGQQSMARLQAPDMMDQSGMPTYRPLIDSATMQKEFRKSLNPSTWEKLGGLGAFLAPLGKGIFDAFGRGSADSPGTSTINLPGR